ncbi:pectin lyase-like protein, partial [Aureobasidium melanogenum]
MLRRQPTKITLVQDDIAAYDANKLKKDQEKNQQQRADLNSYGDSRFDPSRGPRKDTRTKEQRLAPLHTTNHVKRYGSGAPYWFSEITRQGKVAYGTNSSYVVWRNVMDYGAKGDGVTDDTDAINNATYDGNRCAYPCESQTTTPAIVYFPPGTYAVSRPLVMLYYTQFIGDANNLPVILGLPNFYGIAL